MRCVVAGAVVLALLSPAGFFDYVARGARGASVPQAISVSGQQAEAARSLAEAAPAGAAAMAPGSLAMDVNVIGSYLDAKNRASGLLGSDGQPTGEVSEEGRATVRRLYASVPGRAAPDPSVDVSAFYKERIYALLGDAPRISGRQTFLAAVGRVPSAAAPEEITRLRVRLAAVEAVSGLVPASGSLMAPVDEAARSVVTAEVPSEGPAAALVLAAADDPNASDDLLVVAGFERDRSLDASGSPRGALLPNRVLAGAGVGGVPTALVWGEGQSVQPDTWLAFRRVDGTTFWLAGPEGRVALTDSTLSGWVWRHSRASLVDATRVGRTLERYPLP